MQISFKRVKFDSCEMSTSSNNQQSFLSYHRINCLIYESSQRKNPSVVSSFIERKLCRLFLQEYYLNPALVKDEWVKKENQVAICQLVMICKLSLCFLLHKKNL